MVAPHYANAPTMPTPLLRAIFVWAHLDTTTTRTEEVFSLYSLERGACLAQCARLGRRNAGAWQGPRRIRCTGACQGRRGRGRPHTG